MESDILNRGVSPPGDPKGVIRDAGCAESMTDP